MLQRMYGRRGVLVINDPQKALQVNRLILSACEQLNESVLLVQGGTSAQEFTKYRRAVGAVLAEINEQLLNPLYSAHPNLEPSK